MLLKGNSKCRSVYRCFLSSHHHHYHRQALHLGGASFVMIINGDRAKVRRRVIPFRMKRTHNTSGLDTFEGVSAWNRVIFVNAYFVCCCCCLPCIFLEAAFLLAYLWVVALLPSRLIRLIFFAEIKKTSMVQRLKKMPKTRDFLRKFSLKSSLLLADIDDVCL